MTNSCIFKKTEIGNIPRNWDLGLLGEKTVKVFVGRDPTGGKQSHTIEQTDYRIIQSAPVFDGFLDLAKVGHIPEEIYLELKSASVAEDDVLLNQLGDGITFARSCVVPKSALPAIITRSVGCIRCDKNKLDPWFLNAYFVLPRTKKYIESFNSGSSRRAIDGRKMRSFIVPLPPIEEQRIIGHFYKTIQDKIEINQQTNRILESLASAIFKSWFIDFDPVRAKAEGKQPFGMDEETAALFPSEFEDSELGEMPKGWNIGTVAEEYGLTMGQSPPGSTYNEEGEGIQFFQGRTDFGFRYPKPRVYCAAPTRLAEPYDTLVSVRAPVGDVNMARTQCCVGRGLAALRHKSGSRSYTFYSMKALHGDFSLFESEGTVFGCINKQGFSSLKIIIPPDDLVAKFESIAFPLDQAIENNDEQSSTLTQIRDALLPKLLSGEIRAPMEAD